MPKGNSKKKSTKKQAITEPKRHGEIAGIIMIALGIFLGVCVYIKTGTGLLGGVARDILFGLFGLFTYAIPFLFVVIGILIIAARSKRINKGKTALWVILVIAIFSLAHTGLLNKLNLTDGFFAYVSDSYNFGVTGAGSGAIGCLLVYPCDLLVGHVGCIILFITMAIICVLIIANLSIKKMSQDVARAGKKTVEKARETVAVRVAERQKRRLYIENLREDMPEEEDEPDEPEILGEKSFRRKKKQPSYLYDDVFTDSAKTAEPMPTVQEKPTPPIRNLSIEVFDAHQKQEPEHAEEVPEAHAAVQSTPARRRNKSYKVPPISLLTKAVEKSKSGSLEEQHKNAQIIEETLANFGVEAEVVHIVRGPVVTRYELKPAAGVRVKRIKELESDISMSLAARSVKIEAPIPGKAAVGIEVPNSNVSFVHLRPLLESDEFKNAPSPLTFALGKDISGKNYYVDITKMPHILIAGETGAGKSVCINSLVTSLLFKATPEELKMVMIDPKVVELSMFKNLPHLLVPVVTEPKKAASALNWAVSEMTSRYKAFAEKGARDLNRFNTLVDEGQDPLPRIVVIIDELAELMMAAPREVEDAICRIAQLGRAAGIHLIVATQRPSVNVITGIIKANISSRIAFKVNSGVDSRTILDQNGAEKLLGNGDMLYHPTGAPRPIRLQGCYVSDVDIEAVTEYVAKDLEEQAFDEDIMTNINTGGAEKADSDDDADELLPRAVAVVLEYGQASISMIQRRLRVGYARAARLVDEMEQRQIVSPFEGSKARNVLITWDKFEDMFGPREEIEG